MAKKVEITLVDDIDGKPADETVTFGLDGIEYEIDLSNRNAKALRDALADYVDKGTRLRGARRRAGAAARSGGRSNSDAAEIREWANAHGHEVSARGRIPAEIREAYDKAH